MSARGRSSWAPPILVEGCSAHRLELPTRSELHLAVWSGVDRRRAVCSQAYCLRHLYRRRRIYVTTPDAVFDRARADYVADIDWWVAKCVPTPALSAPPALTSIGVLVDRIAEAADIAMVLVDADPASDETHEAWSALARAEDAYLDAATAASERRIRLPANSTRENTDDRE